MLVRLYVFVRVKSCWAETWEKGWGRHISLITGPCIHACVAVCGRSFSVCPCPGMCMTNPTCVLQSYTHTHASATPVHTTSPPEMSGFDFTPLWWGGLNTDMMCGSSSPLKDQKANVTQGPSWAQCVQSVYSGLTAKRVCVSLCACLPLCRQETPG